MAATVQEEKLRQKMKSYWQVYSPSLESMMLSNDAKYLAENEQNEVMSYLPPYQGKRVLELGAGIGRFTARLATVAGHVTAVDFMQEYIDKNEHDNKHMGNINFMCADVTKLDFPAGSFDLVFSNWLFMYLGDKETQDVFERCMKWLSPGGHFFVRESCYHQSGNVKRNENPTLYRTPLEYCHMLHSVTAGGKALFKILRGKSILTYIHYHGNPNQLCFLARRVDGEESDQLAQFLQREYSVVNILGRERAHGYMWWSTGGETTNRDFCTRLNLRPGMRVLDVGCGTGGSAFYMARHYGVHVHGVDLSTNMIHIAIERQGKLEEPLKKRLQFEISDILTVDYEQESYDVIYSRDSIFHIPEKQKLFQHIYRWLRPGGVLFLTDFCSGPATPSKEFLAYVDGAKRYSLAGKDFYVKELESAGFTDVASEDLNEDFMKTSKAELKAFTSAREAFIRDFSEEDFAEISSTLANKVTDDGRLLLLHHAAHILHRTEPRRLNLPPCCQGRPEPALKPWELATGVAGRPDGAGSEARRRWRDGNLFARVIQLRRQLGRSHGNNKRFQFNLHLTCGMHNIGSSLVQHIIAPNTKFTFTTTRRVLKRRKMYSLTHSPLKHILRSHNVANVTFVAMATHRCQVPEVRRGRIVMGLKRRGGRTPPSPTDRPGRAQALGSMSNKAPASQEFLDTNQYSRKSILRYERIFGHTWVSTGGETTTKDFLIRMNLRPGMRVLDVGCGTGGSAFYMARHYGVHVHGVDLSTNMIDIAIDRLNREEKYMQSMIKFEVGDITKVQYDNASYDIIYSRDTILHIPNKEELYRTLLAWLKPGGKLIVTDYCRGDQEHSQEFLDYVKRRGYDLRTVKAYGKVLEEAGFKDVQAVDMTQTFISVLQNELKYFEPTRDAFVQDYSEKDYKEIVDGWRQKLVRCNAGDQAWGMFLATR
ncbi:uncharacterized protein LOC134787065 [Penaeus indicus]|uniref:uncharacterized protein LOC134787065 n=1 Tax=Penaeus indicus TaxID=29960 RepID=UPI00300D4DE7